MLHFCTYFDQNYLLRGLTLYRSLRDTGIDFVLYVACLDNKTSVTIEKLGISNIKIIRLEAIENYDPALLSAKKGRTRIEYYFTLTPCIPLYILDHFPDVDFITYLDADLFFYTSPAPIFSEFSNFSILVTAHRFPEFLRHKEVFGLFNVQFESFRRDEQGLACLGLWREQCIEWCHDRLEGDRFADQKYLDQWPERYSNLHIVKHKGAGLAPWNWATYTLGTRGECVTVDNDILIFYHFHGVKIFNRFVISNGLYDFGKMPRQYKNLLYTGYVRELRKTSKWVLAKTGIRLKLKDSFIRGGGIYNPNNVIEVCKKIPSQIMIIQ